MSEFKRKQNKTEFSEYIRLFHSFITASSYIHMSINCIGFVTHRLLLVPVSSIDCV